MSIGERLKQISDRSLAIVAVSIFLAGVAGAVTIEELRIRSIDDRHAADLARAQSEASDERSRAEADLREQIADANALADAVRADYDQLEQEIGNVRRTVSVGDEETLDLAGIVIDGDDLQGLPDELDGYDDRIFALAAERLDDWSYQRWSSGELLRSQTEVDLELMFDPDFLASMDEDELSVWRGPNTYELNDATGFTSFLSPLVVVSRVPINEVRDLVVSGSGLDPADQGLVREVVDAMFEGDAVSSYFQLWLVGTLATNAPSAVSVVESIQRAGDALYVELVDVYAELTVDDEAADQFFGIREVVMLEAGGDLVLIETVVPTPDRRAGAFSDVTRLLESIRVLD